MLEGADDGLIVVGSRVVVGVADGRDVGCGEEGASVVGAPDVGDNVGAPVGCKVVVGVPDGVKVGAGDVGWGGCTEHGGGGG